jgi:hypothetical protein
MTVCSILLPCLLPVLGGFGLPLSVPPLPETPLLSRVAPEQCLFYLSCAGMATPEADSPNQTEQLLAEPELKKIDAVLESAIKAYLGNAANAKNLPPGTSPEDAVDLIKLLLTRPLAIYIADVEQSGDRPTLRAAAVIHCGDALDRVKAKLEQATQVLPPQMVETVEFGGMKWQSVKSAPGASLTWGFKRAYLLVAFGDGEMQAMIRRAGGSPPSWLATIQQDQLVRRVSSIAYVNVKAIRERFLPKAPPSVPAALAALGLDNVDTVCSVTGLNEKACLQRTFVSLDGEPRGLMRFGSVGPLAAADLASVPADAVSAVAAKIDPAGLFDAYLEMLAKFDPAAVNKARRELANMEAGMGMKLRDDVLKPLGDSVVAFATPGPLGIPSATAVVKLKDPVRAAATYARVMGLLEATANLSGERPNMPKFAKKEVAGKTICTVTTRGSVSFCVTDKELIVAASAKDVEAYLTRSAPEKSLAQVPEIAATLQGEAAPTVMLYCDVRQIFDRVYPMLPVLAAVWQRQGINLDLSILPPAEAIRRHLTPILATVRRTKQGIEIAEQYPTPGVSVFSNAPVMAALLLPAVQAGREAARRMQSQNNMKMIGLALHSYHAAHASFPPAYTTGKDGKPLLSWRVHILPYLDQDALYKQFHLDEPWDSEHNKALVTQMPPFYGRPGSAVASEGKTNYLTVRGEKTIFPGDKGVTLAEIGDGSANTVMTVEVPDAGAVVWTKPDDFQYREENPLNGLTGLWAGGFHAGFADGSVRFLSSSIEPKSLVALFTRNGGEPIDPTAFGQ